MSREKEMQAFLSRTKEWGFTALGLVTTGVILCAALYGTYFSHMSSPSLKASDRASLSTTHIPVITTDIPATSKPARILLPSVNLALDIDDATIDISTNVWPLSETNAQYANFTSKLGSERGTMLLYGHNTWPVMRKTGDLKIGDTLAIVDENGKTWQFRLEKEEIVVPENVGFIYEDVPFRVVMFTCNGWNDQYRRLMFFSPIS